MSDNVLLLTELPTLVDASFPMIHEDPANSTPGSFIHYLKMDELEEGDETPFEALVELLGISADDIADNLGIVKFNNYDLGYYGAPCVVKSKDDDGNEFLELVIGANDNALGLVSANFRVTLEKGGKFAINGANFILDSYDQNVKTDSGWSTEKRPVLVFYGEDEDQIYGLKILVDTDQYSWAKFQRAAQTGKLEKLLPFVGNYTGKAYCGISYVMTPHFKTKTFPTLGYVIPITEITLKPDASGEGYGDQYFLRVKMDSVPGYSLDFSKEMVPSSSVGVISLGSNHKGFLQVQKLVEKGVYPSDDEPFYLWIKGRGRKDDTVPSHLIVEKLLAPVQKALDSQPVLELKGSEKSQDAIEPAVTVDAVEVDEDDEDF